MADDDVAAQVLSELPDVAQSLETLHAAAWSVVDPVLLELCRLRIAKLLEREDERDVSAWPTSDEFGPRERACLAFCEQFILDVAGMDDEIAIAVSDELGPQAFRNFVSALLVIEQRQRLRLMYERLFDP